MKYRKEFDSIGTIKVPDDKYWGASTQRSNKYFDIGDFLVRPIVIKSIAIIKKALENLDPDTDTEMMWYYLEKVSQVKMEILPEASNANIKVRLTLDYEEDYWLLVSIIRILGSNPDRNKVRQLFLNNPDLTKINLFRNDEWKKAQLSKQL